MSSGLITAGSSKLTQDELLKIMATSTMADQAAPAGAHNAIYRGKNLGTSVTSEQYAEIAAGTFTDLYVGDYWNITFKTGSTTTTLGFRIAGFDYWFYTGDTSCKTHHVVIVPDGGWYYSKMNTTETTSGGYVGSGMYKQSLPEVKKQLENLFSGHLLTHREKLITEVTNSRPSASAWYDSTVELMSEMMVYGHNIYSPSSIGTQILPTNVINTSQLPLFMHNKAFITGAGYTWLRDVVDDTRFAYISGSSGASCNIANSSTNLPIRPVFGIC